MWKKGNTCTVLENLCSHYGKWYQFSHSVVPTLCNPMNHSTPGLDYKESWALKNWCFWFVLLEMILVSPLDCKEIQPVHPKGNQYWIFIGRTDAEVETPILWPPDVKIYWKRLWCWKRLKTGGKGDNRDGWVASPTWWTWASSRSWGWTGKPGMLQSMGLQRVGYDWVTEVTYWIREILYKCWETTRSSVTTQKLTNKCTHAFASLCYCMPRCKTNFTLLN